MTSTGTEGLSGGQLHPNSTDIGARDSANREPTIGIGQDGRSASGYEDQPRLVILNWRDWYHPKAGGAEFYLREISRELVRRGWKVDLVTQRFQGALELVQDGGITIHRKGSWLTGYLWAPKLVRNLSQQGNSFSVLESVNTVPFLSRMYLRQKPVVMIHHLAGSELFIEVPIPVSLILFLLELVGSFLNSGSNVVTGSFQSRTKLIRIGYDPNAVRVVRPGFRFRAHGVANTPDSSSILHSLCYLGPLKRYKGVMTLVEAMRLIIADFPDARLTIAGRGYLEPELREYVRVHGLEHHISILGFVPEDRKQRLFSNCSLFVYPSASEGGTSLAVLEAMAMGLPPVVTPTLSEMAAEGRGAVVRFGHPEEIAAAVSGFWKDGQRLKSSALRSRKWAEGCTIESATDKITDLLRKLKESSK
jgi:glycosyltransferase involved in cell wall biosynthesis